MTTFKTNTLNLSGATFYHSQQQQRTGCLWHTAYALTGDEWFLEQTNEISMLRYQLMLYSRGYFEHVIWRQGTSTEAMSREDWNKIFEFDGNIGDKLLCFAIGFCKGQVPHQAAVVFYQDQIIVSDSLRSNFDVIKSHEHFFESQYAKAFYVAHILTASIDKYPHENAAEMFELEFGKGVDL